VTHSPSVGVVNVLELFTGNFGKINIEINARKSYKINDKLVTQNEIGNIIKLL
jgi:hypothetical protein